MTEVEVSGGPNKDRLRLWADALESGEFNQTKETLREMELVPTEDGGFAQTGKAVGYCCLGVACEVAARNGLALDLEDVYETNTVMPFAVADWYGIPYRPEAPELGSGVNPDLYDPRLDRSYAAAEWNDEMDMDFDNIAALIRHTFGLDEDAAPA